MRSNNQNGQFYKSDLDLDPMTLVLNLDLDMVKMYHHTQNEVYMSRHSKVIACTDTHTHRQYENITFPHMRAVNIDKGPRVENRLAIYLLTHGLFTENIL